MTYPLVYIVTGIAFSSLFIIVALEAIAFVVKRAARAAGAGSVVIRDVGAFARVTEFALIALAIARFTGFTSDLTTLTVSGVGALAASLALQTTLSNIISGVLLLSDGVIHLGDIVQYSGVKGKVVRIALRNTWIKSDDGTISVVSNTSLSNGPLVNYSGAERLKKKYAID
jgi:small conductance mechanosensitive channel